MKEAIRIYTYQNYLNRLNSVNERIEKLKLRKEYLEKKMELIEVKKFK